ncbi:MAG: hypothetical protein J0H68_02840 [Sphingobacteriia bacterium]|nr:hypothetical protein [Sphingobacteriia bacterium]
MVKFNSTTQNKGASFYENNLFPILKVLKTALPIALGFILAIFIPAIIAIPVILLCFIISSYLAFIDISKDIEKDLKGKKLNLNSNQTLKKDSNEQFGIDFSLKFKDINPENKLGNVAYIICQRLENFLDRIEYLRSEEISFEEKLKLKQFHLNLTNALNSTDNNELKNTLISFQNDIKGYNSKICKIVLSPMGEQINKNMEFRK